VRSIEVGGLAAYTIMILILLGLVDVVERVVAAIV
jgi:hypothetical protein